MVTRNAVTGIDGVSGEYKSGVVIDDFETGFIRSYAGLKNVAPGDTSLYWRHTWSLFNN